MPSRRTGKSPSRKRAVVVEGAEWSPVNSFEAFKTAPALTAVGSHAAPRYDLSGLRKDMRLTLEAEEMDVAGRYLVAMRRAREDVGGSRIGAEVVDMAEGVSRWAFASPMVGGRFDSATAVHAGLCIPEVDRGGLKGYGYYLPPPVREHVLPFDDFVSGVAGQEDAGDFRHLRDGLADGVLNVYAFRDPFAVEFPVGAEAVVVGGFAALRRNDKVWWTALGGLVVDFDDVERQMKTFVVQGGDRGRDRVIRPRVVPLPGRPDAWKQRLCGVVDLSGRELVSFAEWFLDPEIRIHRDLTGAGDEDDIMWHLKKAAMLCLRLPAYPVERLGSERRRFSLTPSGVCRVDDGPSLPRLR